ncbi:hypothetical protein I3842_15G155100 [Carya illinoinensis]|uniref:TIR domain-containing protein n=1 Tax=Carya illinoinensis TaxID=32201 RepID=A0A922D7Q5_CARIL|nr:hypothetical protein I3842_15G155100 [Carya illinoinensis]
MAIHDYVASRGINIYIDNNIERGDEILPKLFKAIEGSMIYIVVFSKNYSDSRWCLDELLKILECKEMVKQIVLSLFYHVDPPHVRHQKESFGEAFARVEYKFKAVKVKLTKWKVALEKVSNLSGFEFGDRDESEFIQDIIKWVDSKMVDRTPLNVATYRVGIEACVRDIYQHLNMGRNDIICMVGIFGTGGIGNCFLKNIRETSKAGGLIQLQKTLLYEILGISLECHDTDKGINVIRHRLCSKRVLLILDDVDDLVQLETLAGARDWFGPGSRIIITTRDQHLLNISIALELFSWHAFEEDKPIEDYVELSKQGMQYSEGLPLNINHWRSTSDKYKRIPNKNIQEVLSISYDGLDDNEKEIFLDIAFFSKDNTWIIRLWFYEDARHVLEENAGTNNVEGIKVVLPEGNDHDMICLSPKSFAKMKRLKFFISHGARFSGRSLNYISNELRVLDWSNCSLQSLPSNFRGEKLTDFQLYKGHIKDISGQFKNLTIMKFYECKFLTKISNLSSCSNLQELDIRGCENLVEVHDSVGFLDKLVRLRLYHCSNLSFPRHIKLRSLQVLTLHSCSKLQNFQEIDSIHQLQNLKVLCHLKSLSFNNYTNLAKEEINLSFGYFTQLKNLHLTTSRMIKRLEPESSDELLPQLLSSLYELDLSGIVIVSLPPVIESFVELRILKLWHCEKLIEILHLPPNIHVLYARDCFSLERFPKVSAKFQFYTTCGLRELRWIDLSGCHKLDANIGSQAPNPSFVKEHIQDHSCGIIFPGNKIPDWFSHTMEPSNRDSCELDISGPLYLDEIIGIVFCAIIGSNPDDSPSGICVSINGNMLVEENFELLGDWDHWLRYLTGDNLRFIFDSNEEAAVMFKSCRVHIIYKHEENESLTVGECSVDSLNGIQLCKRHRDDEESNLEFNEYPQHKRRSQNLGNSNVVVNCAGVDGDFTEAKGV